MLILDSIASLKKDRIELPFFHKGHLSLKSGTLVTLCLIPRAADPSFARMTEMIVSPISFRSWRHLWRVRAVFREQQGVVNKLLAVIKDANLNVLFEESSSVQNRNLHEVELICDSSAGRAGSSPDEEEARLAALRRRIAAVLIEELEEERGELRLGVRRMGGLLTAWQRFQEASDRAESRTIRAKTTIDGGELVLPSDIRSLAEEESDSRVLLVSDTRERILRVFFPHRDEHFTYVRISHLDSVGALAAITGELARDFDIMTSLTRVKTQGDENHLELLLYSQELSREQDEDARRDKIADLLSSAELRALNVRISYPRSVESAMVTGSPPSVRKRRRTVRKKRSGDGSALRNLSTTEILRQRITEYSVQEAGTPGYRESAMIKSRLSILSRLLAEEGGGEALPKVFLSFDFQREDLFREVEAICDDLGMRLISGRNPTEMRIFRQAIINRILAASCFLGVWTSRDGSMSPWFLWEYGVAQGVGKPTQLLIHRGADARAGIRITPEQHHVKFDGPEFRDKAREVLTLLLQEIRDRVVGQGKA